jgi:hypothetical protein
MKMDFPHLGMSNPADRSRARFAALMATAANSRYGQPVLMVQSYSRQNMRERPDNVNARIGFFAPTAGRAKPQVYGAFLPKPAKPTMDNQQTENRVNLAASAIGKPNFLGSLYPDRPETLRGMEN